MPDISTDTILARLDRHVRRLSQPNIFQVWRLEYGTIMRSQIRVCSHCRVFLCCMPARRGQALAYFSMSLSRNERWRDLLVHPAMLVLVFTFEASALRKAKGLLRSFWIL